MSQLKVNAIRATAASSDAITLATDGTCTAKITNNLSNRNLIINGGHSITQRGGSSTTTVGAFVADRWRWYGNGGTTTLSVETLSSGSPYDLGFRKYSRLTNTANATGAANYRILRYQPEAQDIATSGWNYTSASSYVTLSFWIRSSVAQNFYVYIHTIDGTEKHYCMETGSLTADTWTKITKTIPGGTGVQFDNNNESGAEIDFVPFWGTDYSGSVTLNQWGNFSGSTRTPDMTNTWAGTNGATFDVTGVQLEVGNYPSSFEFRSYGDELARCQRYYQSSGTVLTSGYGSEDGYSRNSMLWPTHMRGSPTLTITESGPGSLIASDSDESGFYVTFSGLVGSTASIFQYSAAAEL